MKTVIKLLKTLVLIAIISSNCSCIRIEIKGAGVFKDPFVYDNRHMAYINIPTGKYGKDAKYLTRDESDGSKIGFAYLGNCGGGISFTGIMIPIIPWIFFNSCEGKDFIVTNKGYLDTLGISLELRYGGKIYDPYFDIKEVYVQEKIYKQDWVKFKILNFSEFKKATDKSIILHKRKPDGTIFTKEIPFDWKIVVEASGGL